MHIITFSVIISFFSLEHKERSFSRIGVKIWNSISCEVRQMSKSNFKNNVDDILLQRLLKYGGIVHEKLVLYHQRSFLNIYSRTFKKIISSLR